MRQRTEARLRKTLRRAAHRDPALIKEITRLERTGIPPARALLAIVGDTTRHPDARRNAAQLFRQIDDPSLDFTQPLRDAIAGGDAQVHELHGLVRIMHHCCDRLTRQEFDILHAVLRTGTPEQRHWVVDQIMFFEAVGDNRSLVRRALIEVLDDRTIPAYVRGWAAERLQEHIASDTVAACIRATEDGDAEVRMWAASTLGVAASWQRGYRDAVIPVLERLLLDDGKVEAWWSVRRQAQASLTSLRGNPEEEARMQAEIQEILTDPAACAPEKRWADFYDHSS